MACANSAANFPHADSFGSPLLDLICNGIAVLPCITSWAGRVQSNINSVLAVFQVCYPLKIARTIVFLVPVFVIYLRKGLWVGYEGHSNQSMEHEYAAAEINPHVTLRRLLFACIDLCGFSARDRLTVKGTSIYSIEPSYSSGVADLIFIGEVWNFYPYFAHIADSNKEHMQNSINKLVVVACSHSP